VFPVKPKSIGHVAVLLVGLLLAACGATSPGATHSGDTAPPEVSDMAPPRVDAVRVGPSGMTLSGVTQPGIKVRLASPDGQAIFATADPQGRWSIGLPPAPEPRIFGLSVTAGDRRAQAEGYVLVTPTGQAALLRAGTGALRLDPPGRPGLRAIDFDRGGGMEVSAAVPPGASVILRLDGSQVDQHRADANGHYEISLGSPTPIKPGAHQVQIFGDGFTDQVVVQVSPPAPLAQGPLRSQLTTAGLRVDWMTPGGGEQSTLLVH
jgi:hypothetical protein